MKLHCAFCGKTNLVAIAAVDSPDLTPWRNAFLKLVRKDKGKKKDKGKPIAKQLRGAPVVDLHNKQIPIWVCNQLAELFDPHSPKSSFAEPKRPPDHMIEMVDGVPRLKASIELERAQVSAAIECRRLVKKARKSGETRGEDRESLIVFANETNDKAALKAFTREREARDSLHAAARRALRGSAAYAGICCRVC